MHHFKLQTHEESMKDPQLADERALSEMVGN